MMTGMAATAYLTMNTTMGQNGILISTTVTWVFCSFPMCIPLEVCDCIGQIFFPRIALFQDSFKILPA